MPSAHGRPAASLPPRSARASATPTTASARHPASWSAMDPRGPRVRSRGREPCPRHAPAQRTRSASAPAPAATASTCATRSAAASAPPPRSAPGAPPPDLLRHRGSSGWARHETLVGDTTTRAILEGRDALARLRPDCSHDSNRLCFVHSAHRVAGLVRGGTAGAGTARLALPGAGHVGRVERRGAVSPRDASGPRSRLRPRALSLPRDPPRGAQATAAEKSECAGYEAVHGRVSGR